MISPVTAIAENLKTIHQRIEAACLRAQRPATDVTLLCVSKKMPPEALEAAWRAQERHFGENYAQELRDKAGQLGQLEGLFFHFIGPLQTNKAKYVAQFAYAFHALDRLDVAQELSRRRQNTSLKCFVEVNLGDEATKAGISAENLGSFLDSVKSLPALEVVGLMTLPPLQENPEANRPYFRRLAQLAKIHGLRELSMGTTSDFEIAIEEGATIVRVGTAIFGERPTKGHA